MGRLLASLPEGVVRGICVFAVRLLVLFRPGRKRMVMNAMHHAYPEKSEAWRNELFLESSARMFEMAFFMIAAPYFSQKRTEQMVEVDAETQATMKAVLKDRAESNRSIVLVVPHLCLSESALSIPSLLPDAPPLSIIFRPLNQPKIDAWIRQIRSRFGAHMLSRRNGFNEAMSNLRKGEIVGVLFDQNAGRHGSTITFFDRICSVTDLPGIFAKRFDSEVILVLPERLSLWRARLQLKRMPACDSVGGVAIETHRHLQEYLSQDFNKAADWLWMHNRWDHHVSAYKRFRISQKKNNLALQNERLNRSTVPSETRLYVRLPNWLGDVVMALPVLRAIRKGRPDFEITLIGKAAFEPLVKRMDIADQFISLPPRGRGYFRFFYQLRLQYPDSYLLFTNSFRSDLEAFLTRCIQRMGMVRPGKWRPLLNTPYSLPAPVDEVNMHQTRVWGIMARGFGLKESLDCSSLNPKPTTDAVTKVGLICGTENAPEKRWPIGHWRSLITLLVDVYPDVVVTLYGTARDREITDQVADGFPSEHIQNLAGETDLDAFCDGLSVCSAVVCNDTGGMHLANLLGTPVVGVFGPTNPVRTGPIFDAPVEIVQPEGCPATGGSPIAEVEPNTVFEKLRSVIKGGVA